MSRRVGMRGCAAGVVVVALSGPGLDPVTDRVAFETVRGSLIVLRGAIGSIGPVTVLIDTGTSRSVVDRAIAERLQLPSARDQATPVGSRPLTVARVILPALQLGPLQVRDAPVLATDLRDLSAQLGTHVDAIVGLDVLRGHCLVIDYLTGWLSFRCTDDWPSRVSLDRTSPHVVAPLTIDGSVHRLVVDTGADAIVLFQRALARVGRVEVDGYVEATRLDGTVRLERFTAAQVTIGDVLLRNEPIFVMRDTCDGLGFDGLLGARRLGRVLQLDLARMVVSWRR